MSDSWISWKPRIEEPSKPSPSTKASSVSCVRRNGEVLHQSRQVAEAEVDDLDVLVLYELDDLGGGALLHGFLLVPAPSGTREPRALARQPAPSGFPCVAAA